MSADNHKPFSCGRGTLIVLVLVFIAANAFVFFGLFQVKAALDHLAELTREAGKTSNGTLASTQRAYVFGMETQIQTNPGNGTEQTAFFPKWENIGNTPANPVYFEIRCPILVEKNEEISQQAMHTEAGQQLKAPTQPMSKLKATLAPHQATINGGACIFSKEQLILLLPSRPHLYLTARAIYRDVFTGTPLHITEYCSDTIAVKGPDNKILFQTNACDKFNCVDDQCPAEERAEIDQTYGKIQ